MYNVDKNIEFHSLSFTSVFTSFSKMLPCIFSEAFGYFCVVQKWTPTEPVKIKLLKRHFMNSIWQNFWYKNIISGVVIGLLFSYLTFKPEKGWAFNIVNFIVLSLLATIFSMGWDKLLNWKKK